MYNYLIPTITALPVGHDCTMILPAERMTAPLRDGTGLVRRTARVYHEGEVEHEAEETVEFHAGAPVGANFAPFIWKGSALEPRDHPGYLEMNYRVADGEPRFTTYNPPTPYAILNAPGRKSFFTDNNRKYSNPSIIAMVAEYGRYVDGYPAVVLDRARDYGESILLINPYMKAVIGNVLTHDQRSIRRIKVPPSSARRVDLSQLLHEDEERWRGRLQFTANNRLVTFNVKHSLANPDVITDHEHFDAFRADPTHMPATQLLRNRLGGLLGRGGKKGLARAA